MTPEQHDALAAVIRWLDPTVADAPEGDTHEALRVLREMVAWAAQPQEPAGVPTEPGVYETTELDRFHVEATDRWGTWTEAEP